MRIHATIIFISIFLFASCEEEYLPPASEEGQKYVVEGYIEAGEDPFPAYVILTKTLDFYSEIGPDQFNELFVHDADVRVTDGDIEVVFPEICLSELPPEVRNQIAGEFGYNGDSLRIDFCVYLDVLGSLHPQIGKTYDLRIQVEDHIITASTRIPEHVPVNALNFASPPGEPNDSLAQLRVLISDPPAERNFYRYFVSVNGGNLQTTFSSVEEDLFFDGKTFDFQLYNPQTTKADIDPHLFGLYFVGDSITIKWTNIDEAHFDFWNTLEFSNANQGPFSSYTRLQSNINGGLGIWGGYSVSYYHRLVEY